MPGRLVAGAWQTGCICQADWLQVPSRLVAGAGQGGCRCRAGKVQVPGRELQRSRVDRPRVELGGIFCGSSFLQGPEHTHCPLPCFLLISQDG